jgi:hypothetical protein
LPVLSITHPLLAFLSTCTTLIIDTERDHVVQQVELAEMEQAEIQVAPKAVAVSMDNLNQIRCNVDTLSREINQYQEVLQAREQAIKSKVDSYKCHHGLNHEVKSRYYKGQRFLAPFDYSRRTTGERLSHEVLSSGTDIPANPLAASAVASPASRGTIKGPCDL